MTERIERKSDKLKPCPFCGRKAILRRDSHGCYIGCENGMCSVMPTTWYFDEEEKVIETWNRRANDDRKD